MININNKSWDKLRVSDIRKLLSNADDETVFFEFKSDDETPAKLAKEISALSNTYGGYILLGVNDDKTIGGCKKWTEQRIHTAIHDSITPVPNFDVKKFKFNNTVVIVIKIEAGEMPPYITNKGQIFERISSGSFPINDSGKLHQLYTKRQDQLARTKNKIELDNVRIDSTCPDNLCGYLDLGFSVVFSELSNFQKTFYVFDFNPIVEYLKSTPLDFSISRVGHSVVISMGNFSATTRNGNKAFLMNNGIHNFIEIMCDGSVRSRIILTANPDDTKADISYMKALHHAFSQVYSRFSGRNFLKAFVHAQKYERLTVIKQFVPYYNVPSDANEQEANIWGNYLIDHKNKYGNNLIIESSRLPKNDYNVIDKRWFNTCGLKYDTDNLLHELFSSAHFNLGFIDSMKKL